MSFSFVYANMQKKPFLSIRMVEKHILNVMVGILDNYA